VFEAGVKPFPVKHPKNSKLLMKGTMMKKLKKLTMLATLAVAALCGAVNAAEVIIGNTADAQNYTVITESTTWTSDNVYRLAEQIYVDAGATLTIEPGTLIQSEAGTGGSLAICRGAKIYAKGTRNNPIIFTSTNDDFKTWRPAAQEWGNLTIMGNAYISEKASTGGTSPFGNNSMQMEGLFPIAGSEYLSQFGGTNDNDNSGVISYVSLRYGGKVIGAANELNGISLGGVGRGTDMHHIEIMNNIDDGIEIWGGTVNLKYVSIWNVGDDSFDLDCGWRGKAQFGLIVQGYSVDAVRGSGICCSAFEMDGAEDRGNHPRTTAAIYNFTVVGQPFEPVSGGSDTSHIANYKDNAYVQFRNCIFMDHGGELLANSGGAYTMPVLFPDAWTTPYNYDFGFTAPAGAYMAQVDGMLCEMKDSVFYNNTDVDTADLLGVFDAANHNVTATAMPIQKLERAASFITAGGDEIAPVTFINPCAANDAVYSEATAPMDGFFTPARFRGAFSSNHNWLGGWTAADQYGMTDTSMNVASKAGDITQDGSVDLQDLMILSSNWLN
jgi:hypothetical protein